MAKYIDVFGIKLENYTVRENMQFFEEYLKSDELNTVMAVTADMLMAASENEELTEVLKQADFRVIADTTVLETADEMFEQQHRQIRKQEMEEQLLRCLIRKKKRVFWIGASKEQQKRFESYMQENYPDLNVAGTMSVCIDEENIEHIINEINSADADVLFLNFHSPWQEQFVNNYKHLFHVRLCICLGDGIHSRYSSGVRISKLKGLIDQTFFKRKVIKYKSEHGE